MVVFVLDKLIVQEVCGGEENLPAELMSLLKMFRRKLKVSTLQPRDLL